MKNRFPEDRLLRKHGWRIHARPRIGPALWRKGKLIRSHALILEEITKEEGSGGESKKTAS